MRRLIAAAFACIWWLGCWVFTGAQPIPEVPQESGGILTLTVLTRADCTPETRTLPVTIHSASGEFTDRPEARAIGVECQKSIPAFSYISFDGAIAADDRSGRSRFVIFPTSEPEVLRLPSGILSWAGDVRESFRSAARLLPGDGGQLLPGLVVGDTSLVSDSLTERLKITSLTHLMAVSGANCVIVVGMIYGLAAMCGASRVLRIGLALAGLAVFVVIVTAQPSVVRASIMTVIGLVALGLGQAASGVIVLSLAVILSLMLDPWLAREFGFVLSVVATASLLVLSAPIAARIPSAVPRPVALALSAPVAAAVGCQPIIMLLTPSMPLFGILANLCASPFAPVATIVGMAAALLSAVPIVGPVLTSVAWIPASLIALIARVLSSVPGASIPWPLGVLGFACAALMSAGLIIALTRFRAGLLLWSTGLIVGASVTVGAGLVARATVPREWSVAQCDVGQGDAMLYRHDDHIVLIDTGLEAEPITRCLDLLGVTKINVLILTHFDADHSGAATSLNRDIDVVIHGPTVDDADKRLLADLRSDGAILRQVWAGDRIAVGTQTISVLWPFRDIATEPSNPSSLVTLLVPERCTRCLSFVNLGDLPAAEQRRMLERKPLPQVDVIKVSHHGSRDNQPQTYSAARAAVAIVGVGAGNGYGHPTDDAVHMVESAGSRVVRSDTSGTVVLSKVSGQISFWAERHP
ncbi:MAG: hypothetical protein RIS25_152 [Actinomycetota bacterium]|jgi:competence protein ComEC